MAEHDSSEVKWELDATGGALTDITAHVLVAPDMEVKNLTDDDWTALGDTVEIKAFVNRASIDGLTMTLKYNSTTAAFAARGDVRTLKRTLFTGGPTTSIEAGILKWNPKIEGGKKTRIEVEMCNTGAITETP